eukprot:12624281-Prorocentrum_lima.AAC.1
MAERYFQHRAISTEIRKPSWDAIQRTLIRAAGSAPGLDGLPYETLHRGSHIVTAIVGQALYVTEQHQDQLHYVLGPPIDLQ